MKKIVFIIFFNMAFAKVDALDWRWNIHVGSELKDATLIASDNNKNIYLFGEFDGNNFIVNSDTLFHNNGNNFLIKLDENGNKVWDKQIFNSSPGSCFGYGALQYDNSTNSLYLIGTFCGQLNISGHVFNSSIEMGYLSKFDIDGNCLWAKSISGNNKVEIICCTNDEIGNLYISGYVQDSTYFDINKIPRGGFIAKYDTSGDCVWVKNICGVISFPFLPYIQVRSIVYKNDFLFISGLEYNDTILIDTISFIHPNKYGNIIGKYESNGDRIWLKEEIGIITEVSYGGMSVDNNENIYTAGYFKDTLTVNGNNYFTSPLEKEYYLTKYDTDGNLIWFKQGNSHNSSAEELVCDSAGNFYVAGYFSDTTNFGNIDLVASSTTDMFLARFNENGNCIGVKNFGKANAICMTVDNDLNPTVVSSFSDSVFVDNHTFSTYGQKDIIISKSDEITDIGEPKERRIYTLTIYQNPNNGKFNIAIPEDILLNNDNIDLSIYDSQGKLIQNMPLIIDGNIIPVSIQAEAKGVYIVRLRNKFKSYTGRLIFE